MAMPSEILLGPDCNLRHQRPIAPLLAVLASFSASLVSAACCFASSSRSSFVSVRRETFGTLVNVSARNNVSSGF